MSQSKICPQCGEEYPLDQRFCPKDGTTLRLQGGSADLVGSIVADRYHVLRKLGEGGMGQVYLAEHVKMGRKSALKVMNPGMVNDADAISRFNREAANASRINHPNVAAVYDFGETGEGLIYLAMEFVEGPSLTKLIEQQGALPPLRAGDITRQAGEALTVAHDMGIVHRDLKPDNIMIAKTRDGGDLVKVVDFGIAKAADNAAQKVTKTGLVVGTPEYMSPEQLAGDKLDGRSDIYSLALVAFNMLTGHLPFPAETVQESMIMRLTDLPKRLAEMKPDVAWTPAVQAVLDRALERDASKRYQTANEFGRDLFRAIEQMPMSAVAEMGTQVISAPPGRGTRDAGGATAGGGGREAGGATGVVSAPNAAATAAVAAVPATRVGSAADVAPSPGAPVAAKKSNTMLIAAAAAVIVIGGGGAAFMMSRGGSKAPQQTAQQGAPAQTAANPAPAVNVAASLDSLDPLVDENATDASAREALQQLGKLQSQISGDDARVHAQIVQAQALMQLKQNDRACQILRDVKPMAVGTRLTRVNTFLQLCSKAAQ